MKRLVSVAFAFAVFLAGCGNADSGGDQTMGDETMSGCTTEKHTTTENTEEDTIGSDYTPSTVVIEVTTEEEEEEETGEYEFEFMPPPIPKEAELTQIFLDNRGDFEKIKDIVTDNYPYFYVRYEGEGHEYNTIKGGKEPENITDDIIEIDYILDFIKKNDMTGIRRPTLDAVIYPTIIFSFFKKYPHQGIQYIYYPEEDSYYDNYNRYRDILHRIDGNWFYYYYSPPD